MGRSQAPGSTRAMDHTPPHISPDPSAPDRSEVDVGIPRSARDQLQGVNLYLIGMMGCGKTTIGHWLAQALGYQFFDTDQLIEASTGQTIPAIFANEGETRFRDLETQVLAELSPYFRLVIATGGGIVQRPQNWGYLHHGIVIWLDVVPDLLITRLRADPNPRPLLQTEDPYGTLLQLLDQRRPLYAQADIHIRIEDPTSPAQMGLWIWEQLQRRLRA